MGTDEGALVGAAVFRHFMELDTDPAKNSVDVAVNLIPPNCPPPNARKQCHRGAWSRPRAKN